MRIDRWGIVSDRGDRWTLLCDIDRPHPTTLQTIIRVLTRVGLRYAHVSYRHTPNGHWHLAIRLTTPIGKSEAIALQLMLGSDPKREAYNLFRVRCGAKWRDFNLLFERKIRCGHSPFLGSKVQQA